MCHDNAVIVFGMDRQRELEHAAGTDGLTGLHNRRWMNEAFSRQLDRCARDSAPSSLVLIDVDALKAYNDRAGHLAGDLLICAVADVLARHIRPGDLLARFGGDEFCLLLPATPLPDALNVAERLRASVDEEVSSKSRYMPPFLRVSRALLTLSSKRSCAAPTRRSIGESERPKHRRTLASRLFRGKPALRLSKWHRNGSAANEPLISCSRGHWLWSAGGEFLNE
jgi:diguanylate cyclase (GGDEF)-like protein